MKTEELKKGKEIEKKIKEIKEKLEDVSRVEEELNKNWDVIISFRNSTSSSLLFAHSKGEDHMSIDVKIMILLYKTKLQDNLQKLEKEFEQL